MSQAAGSGSIADVVEEARQAALDGMSSFWVTQIFGLDAMTTLAVVAGSVPDIELGTAVVPTYPRHPWVMAQQALTTNAAAGGRFTLGIGLSHQIVIEGMWGYSFDKPVRHLREYLEVLVPLTKGEPVYHHGEVFTANGALSVPGAASPSVLVAALGTQMLEVTARLADGTITWCVGPRTLAEHTVPTIVAAAERAGRPAPRVVASLPVCVTGDVAGARARAGEAFAFYGHLPSYRAMMDREGVAGPAELAIVGSAAQVQDQIGALAEAGVTDFAASEYSSDPDERAATRAVLRSMAAG